MKKRQLICLLLFSFFIVGKIAHSQTKSNSASTLQKLQQKFGDHPLLVTTSKMKLQYALLKGAMPSLTSKAKSLTFSTGKIFFQNQAELIGSKESWNIKMDEHAETMD